MVQKNPDRRLELRAEIRVLMTKSERLLTVEDVAQCLPVRPRTVYQWVHERYIPVVKLGVLVRFNPASVSEWLKTREVPGRAERRLELDLP